MSRKWIDDDNNNNSDIPSNIPKEDIISNNDVKPHNGNGNGNSNGHSNGNGNGKPKRKKEIREIVINNEGHLEPLEDTSIELEQSPQMMPMPQEIAEKFQASMNNNQFEDKTKYTFADKFHNPENIDYYTEFPNITGDSGVYQANRLVACAEHLSTMIFGDDPHIKESAMALVEHVKTHKLNMTSHKRKRILESVSAVKADADMIQNSKDLEKRLGIRK